MGVRFTVCCSLLVATLASLAAACGDDDAGDEPGGQDAGSTSSGTIDGGRPGTSSSSSSSSSGSSTSSTSSSGDVVDAGGGGSDGGDADASQDADANPDAALDDAGDAASLAACDGTLLLPAEPSVPFPRADAVAMPVVADFDLDGLDDVAMGTRDGVVVAFARDTGLFRDPIVTSEGLTSLQPLAIYALDLQGNGVPDLVARTTNGIVPLLGLGDGRFMPLPALAAPAGSSIGTAGDLDGDGNGDLVLLQNDASTVWLGDGMGAFSAGAANATPYIEAPFLADFDGDGNADIFYRPGNGSNLDVVVLEGLGDGTFAGPPLRTTAPACKIVLGLADLDGNGAIDVMCSGGFVPGATLARLMGNGDGTFTQIITATASEARNAALGDFDGDGRLDVAAADNDASLFVYRAGNDLSFSPPVEYTGFAAARAVLSGHFDGDALLDVATISGDVLTLFRGRGDGTLVAPLEPRGLPRDRLAIGDFDEDGISDVVSTGGGEIQVRFGSLDRNATTTTSIALSGGTEALVVADVNGDDHLDVLVTRRSRNTFGTFLGNGLGGFEPIRERAAGSAPQYLAAGDFDLDGRLDVAVLGLTDKTLLVYRGAGDGTFPTMPTSYPNAGSAVLLTADWNEDGRTDVVLGSPTGNLLDVRLTGANGMLGAPSTLAPPLGPRTLAAGDLDGDGHTDLVTGNQIDDDSVGVLYGIGDGTFAAVQSVPFLSGAGGVSLADLNRDGRLDVLVAGTGMAVLLNRGARTFAAPQPYRAGPTFDSAAAVDLDADGRLDVALARYQHGNLHVLWQDGCVQ